MGQQINSILESNEKVVWEGAPNRKVLALHFILTTIITLAISWFMFSLKVINYTNENTGQPGQVSGSTVGIIVLGIGLLIAVSTLVYRLVVHYAITHKRVIIKSGLIGTDFKSVYFDQIKNIIVDVGLIGKIFSTGSIKIDIGKVDIDTDSKGHVSSRTKYDVLSQIDKPYEVYKNMQSSLEERKESLYSGRADKESNPEDHKK